MSKNGIAILGVFVADLAFRPESCRPLTKVFSLRLATGVIRRQIRRHSASGKLKPDQSSWRVSAESKTGTLQRDTNLLNIGKVR
jgi:hypothetical protein